VASSLACAAGVALFLLGILGLMSQLLPSRTRLDHPDVAQIQILFGAFLIIETVPRISEASSQVVSLASTLAFVPLLAAIALLLIRRFR
jgi:hypothetical protein